MVFRNREMIKTYTKETQIAMILVSNLATLQESNKNFLNRDLLEQVKMQSEVLRTRETAGEIKKIRAIYQVNSGKVEFYIIRE